MKCCCGKYDYTGEVLVVNDIVHEHLGPKGNMCGPLHAIEIRDLRAQLSESKEQIRRRDVFCQEKAELAEFERGRRKALEEQLTEERRKREEAEETAKAEGLNRDNLADALAKVILRAKAAESDRDLAEKAVSDLMDKYSELEDERDHLRYQRRLCWRL